ncbi:hypothetical protein C8R48DRAFT_677965 [Suillus tomentosus]|nr:hypothetical protein C8R48DRAFT_677965 [Suillus tomentosus]
MQIVSKLGPQICPSLLHQLTFWLNVQKVVFSDCAGPMRERYKSHKVWVARPGSTTRLQAEVMSSKSPKSRKSKESKNNPHTKQPSSESQAENVVPSDLAKGVLGTVASILMTVQSAIKNKSDFRTIVKKCETIGEILKRVTKDTTDDNLPRYLAHALSEVNS